ncbi:winged helix-turn-helix transcriptional regulator [Bradyrhizobium yuanmingense]|nr:winged helix-turn-helix transcriptional regulator [Bradyrhizobium yuanmingense]MDF0518475.1 winged helix-turn-helix transcriptional regulator [Bradyrhizobium yuanmingense]
MTRIPLKLEDPVCADERRGSFRRVAAFDRLEQDGLVSRTVFAEKPLRVEYELTDAAYGLLPAFKEILSWSRLYGDARLETSQQA